MPISQQGQVNLSALNVPQVLVQIVPPQYLFGGTSTNIGGVVGTASWGPVGTPQNFGTYQQYAAIFGPTINRKYDMGAHVIVATMQGANNFYGVRVTDGTDTAASIAILTNCLTVTSKYTGKYGANIKVTIAQGSAAGTKKVIISAPSQTPEIFDNIGVGLTANALWVAMALAINAGTGSSRGPSAIVVASAGIGVTAPANAAYSLAGGTDGVTTITTSVMLGADVAPRTGIYAFRGTPISRFDVCDLDDSTSWSAQNAFALDYGVEAICTTPAGDTIANAVTVLATSGIDSYGISISFGDWMYYVDLINNVAKRLISPQALKLGLRGNLSPQQSSLNKPLLGLIGTQSTFSGSQYSYADFQSLSLAGLDLVCLDPSISDSFIFRLGVNTSSSPVIQDESYTDVTNFLSKSIFKIAAQYVGKTQTADSRRRARTSLMEFLALAQTNGIIGTANNSQAYQVILDDTNNPQASVALGYMYAYIKVIYLGIIRYFIVNLEGGASVVISNNPPNA